MYLSKKSIFLLLFSFGSQFGVAQTISPITITTEEGGTDHRSNTPVPVKKYRFHLPVYKFYPLSDGSSTVVQLRKLNASGNYWANKGEVTVFDAEDGTTLWNKKMKYLQSSVFSEGNVIFEQRLGKLSRLNPETGAVLWKSKSSIHGIYPYFNMLLGYNYGSTGFQTLHGLDINTGKSIWNRNVSSQYGWERLEILDDSTRMIIGAGLHTINLVNGKGWDMPRETYAKKTDIKKVGLAVLGGAAAVAFGGYMIPGDLTDMYLNISSNVLFDEDNLYYAAKNKISCRSMNGDILWDHDLNPKITSKSHLFKVDNVVYMINMGYAMKYGNKARFGTPFVAGFDAQSGEQLFMKIWEDRKSYVTDFMIENDELRLLYQNKIETFKFSEKGLSEKNMVEILVDEKMKRFTTNELFIKLDSTYTSLSDSRDHYFVIDEKNEVLRLDNDFKLTGKEDQKKLYRNYLESAGYIFLGNSEETVVLSKETNKPVATLLASFTARRYGNDLYWIKKDTVHQWNIAEFL